jgi:hypothetical protein
MKKDFVVTLISAAFVFSVLTSSAAEVCKVTVMGRVCTTEGVEETSSHMKTNAVADVEAQKKIADNSKENKAESTSGKIAKISP